MSRELLSLKIPNQGANLGPLISSALTGLLTGFLMCIPVGPINVWVIQTVIKRGKTEAYSLALGGSAMDAVYFYLILSGLSLVSIPPTLTQILKVAGTVLIFILGVLELVRSQQVPPESSETPLTSKVKINKAKLSGFFLLGVILYTSNPTLVLTMTALAAFIKSLEMFPFTQPNIISLSFGLATGSFLWFFMLTHFTLKFKEVIQKKYLKLFAKISGCLMVALSLMMATKLLWR